MNGKKSNIAISGRKSTCALIVALICLLPICGLIGYSIGVQEPEQIKDYEVPIVPSTYSPTIWALSYLLGTLLEQPMMYDEPPFINVTSKKNSYAVEIRTEGAVISGLNIRNDGPGLYTTGIKITASNVTIENCNIFDTPVGIAVWSSGNTISNCTFWGCEDEAILLLGSYNKIINCVFYFCGDGIELQESCNNTFINDRFLYCSHAGIDGIKKDNNHNLISFCVFLDNLYGAFFIRSENNEFSNCTFRNNKRDIWEKIDHTN